MDDAGFGLQPARPVPATEGWRRFHRHWAKWFNLCNIHKRNEKSSPLATPNYSFEKRQRDLAKKQRKEEKLKRKSEPAEAPPNESEPQPASADKVAP